MTVMDSKTKRVSKLFNLSLLEPIDPFEDQMDRGCLMLQQRVGDVSDKVSHDLLIALVSQGSHDDVCAGLLYGVLTNSNFAPRYNRDLMTVNRDGLKCVFNICYQIILERYPRLLDDPRKQLVWFIHECVKAGHMGVDQLVIVLFRQLASSDISSKNIWLADQLVTMLLENNKTWLCRNPTMVGQTIYAFLRLISDHFGPQFAHLRQKEVALCTWLLRERFDDCAQVGRDLVRLLGHVARLPEFEPIIRDLYYNTQRLSPNQHSLLQLVNTRTSRRFLANRVTPDVEKKVAFILTSVKFSGRRRYFEWIQKQCLSTPESQFLRADIIRFVCGVICPTNEILASETTQRWAFIQWLLQTCTSPVAAAYAREALFFDWFFYNTEQDNIMCIEPAMLLMSNSLKTQPSVTNTLLDFLTRSIQEFCAVEDVRQRIRAGIQTSFRQILEKRVVGSLAQFFTNPRLAPELRGSAAVNFAEFLTEPKPEVIRVVDDTPASDVFVIDDTIAINDDSLDLPDADFSDEEGVSEEKSSKKEKTIKKEGSRLSGKVLEPITKLRKSVSTDIGPSLNQLDPALRALMNELQAKTEPNAQLDVMQRLLVAILQKDDMDDEEAGALADCICYSFQAHFTKSIFPDDYYNPKAIAESVQRPIYIVFRNLCMTPEDDASREPLCQLVAEMYARQPKIGYHLLYFLKASDLMDERMSAYRDLMRQVQCNLDEALVKDMNMCQADDFRMFAFLIPAVYSKLSNVAVPNVDLMRLVVGSIDSIQLHELVCEVLQGNLQLFRKDSILSILNASLEWETIEQYFLWQLIAAEDVPLDWVLPLLCKLEFPGHAEPLSQILITLRRIEAQPSTPMLKAVLSRNASQAGDLFSCTALKILLENDEDKFTELISALFLKTVNTEAAEAHKGGHNLAKSRKPNKGPALEQIVGHVDMMLRHYKQCQNFFAKDQVQNALREVKMKFPDLARQYEDLFVAVDLVESVRPRGRFLRRGRKVASYSPGQKQGSDSSDEDAAKGGSRTPKKRRKVQTESDSD